MPLPSGAVGLNADQQLFPQGQRGGMAYYPHSGIVSGMVVTAGTVTATAVPLSVSAGSARLDGVLVQLPSALSAPALVSGTGFDLAAPQSFDVYLNPTRVIPAGTALPGSPTNVNSKFILVTNEGDYQNVVGYYKSNAAADGWEEYNPAEGPPARGHNNQIFSEVLATNIVLGNLSLVAEKEIYTPSGYPPYVQAPSKAWIRRSAAIHLARVVVANTAAVITAPDYSRAAI
jgi:hypothetical protein